MICVLKKYKILISSSQTVILLKNNILHYPVDMEDQQPAFNISSAPSLVSLRICGHGTHRGNMTTSKTSHSQRTTCLVRMNSSNVTICCLEDCSTVTTGIGSIHHVLLVSSWFHQSMLLTSWFLVTIHVWVSIQSSIIMLISYVCLLTPH